MDTADRELFARSVRAAVDGAGRSRGDVDAALDALGWRDALADDPRAAVTALFEAQGETNATSSALRWVLGGDVLPAIDSCAPPGRLDGDRLHVAGLVLAPLDADAVSIMVAADDGDVGVVTVATSALTTRDVEGIDPSLRLVTVAADGVPCAPRTPLDPRAWEAAVALGRVAIAHELVGASRAMLRLARDHALGRVQFDRPIAQFQAVRHRLAETLVAVETADAALDAAWLDGTPLAASMAKSVAGRAARTAARHCQQVLAGIGFTTEHPLHLFVRRAFVLDRLLGASRALTADLGREVLTTRRLPPLLPL